MSLSLSLLLSAVTLFYLCVRLDLGVSYCRLSQLRGILFCEHTLALWLSKETLPDFSLLDTDFVAHLLELSSVQCHFSEYLHSNTPASLACGVVKPLSAHTELFS